MSDSLGSGTSSSYGSYHSPPSCFAVDVCPEVLLAGLTVGAAAGFFALYQQITKKGAARKKKRGVSISDDLYHFVYDFTYQLSHNGKNALTTMPCSHNFGNPLSLREIAQ